MAPPAATSDSPASALPAWQLGLDGARRNLVPALILQAFALSLVLAYFLHGPTQELLTRFATWRMELGILSSALSTGIFGGVIPFLVLRWAFHDRSPWIHGAYLTAFWALRGMDVDLLYRLQAAMSGTEPTLGTIAAKVLFDQLIVCPLYAVPLCVLAYLWKDVDFSLARLRAMLTRGWYRRLVLPGLIANFGVWFPSTFLIYSLPLPLQVPLFNLVLCFWALLFAYITDREAGRTP